MKPISPAVLDVDAYASWLNAVIDQRSCLIESRALALVALSDRDEAIRCLAIESFIYVWSFDASVAQQLLSVSINDDGSLARYTAAATIKLMHLRCVARDDKLLLEGLLREIIDRPNQVPEIVQDIGSYLSIFCSVRE